MQSSYRRIITYVATIALSVLLFSTIIPNTVFAADGWGWSGGSMGGGGGGGGYGEGVGCSSVDNKYREDCAGVSWIFYEYVGGESHEGTAIYFNSVAGGNSAYISGQCAVDEDDAGFWHLGVNAQGLSASWVDQDYFLEPGDTSDDHGLKGYSNWTHVYTTTVDRWGHWDTVSWGQVPEWAPYKNDWGGGMSHNLYKKINGSYVKMYSATKFGSKSEVYENFKQAKYFEDGAVYDTHSYGENGAKGFTDTYAFCYGPYMNEKTADYSGKTEASGSNGDVSANGGAYAITFTHSMHKNTGGTSGYNPGSSWSTAVSGNGGKSASGTYSLTSTSWSAVRTDSASNNAADSKKLSGTLLPGESRSFCQNLTYQNHVSTKPGNTTTATTADVCRTVSRKKTGNSITGQVNARVKNTGKSGTSYVAATSNNQVFEVDTSYAIQFRHQLKRTDDDANGTVDVGWYTEVSGVNNRGFDVTPKGTAVGSSANKQVYTGLADDGNWHTIRAYDAETITGSLLPDETKTFCQKLHYERSIDVSGNTETDTGWYCVSVHTAKTSCSDGAEYGVHSGQNKGRIQAQKNNGTWLDTGLLNTGDGEIIVWARPSNKIHFKEEMCEGAELSNQYYDLDKDISYGITATSNAYMDNLSPSSWNNSNIKGRAHANDDIFGTHTYVKNTTSPSSSNNSTKYDITNNHVGSSFFQKLTWTDLWISNNAVSSAHNGSGTATATATVYIPYNYRTTPETTSNNTPYILPGTSTYTIDPSITVSRRTNSPVNGTTPYATKTKTTKYQVISYYISNGTNSNDVTIKNNGYFTGSGTINLADYCSGRTGWGNGNPSNCSQLASSEGTYDGNGTSSEENKVALPSVSLTVAENIPIGTKICTVVGVWPSDSHNTQDDIASANQEWEAIDGKENTNNRMWKISEPSCSTVAKRPNIQVKQNDAYAEQKINTATSNRKLYGTDTMRSYGSWSEFALISGSTETTGILGMGSGASLWGGINTNSDANKYCYVSSMTFSNSHCSGENRFVGKLGINKLLASDPENIAKQIKTRYTISNGVTYGQPGQINVLQAYGSCIYDESTGLYTPYVSGGYGRPTFNCLDNGTNYTKVRGSAATDSYPSVEWLKSNSAHKANAWVTEAEDTLYIRQDSYYGSLSGSPNRENTEYTNINELAQRIYIADKIYISPEVTHIDAWLIANEINTCYPGSGVAVSVNNCNQQLTIGGPVIAKKIYLNRTYGGGKTSYARGEGNSSTWWTTENSEGAEIFTVNPSVYLWSYSQSQRYSQAVTTYAKELPTRY